MLDGMTAIPVLTELRLRAFKSYREQVMPLDPMTLIVGRNGSGKSNALDALALLALLADDRDINDLERGDQEVAGLRGGLSGAAPFDTSEVRVGATVDTEVGVLDLELVLEGGPHPEIVSESLVLRSPSGRTRNLFLAHRTAAASGIADISVYSGAAPRSYQVLTSRLAATQVMTKIPQDTAARRSVVAACAELVAALRGIFVLDPVPAQMREYVRIGSLANRSGSTLSALLYELRDDADAWQRLTRLVQDLVETPVAEVTFAEARLPDERLVDVMVALREVNGASHLVPARLLSDGTLRYLAIVASLLVLRPDRAPGQGTGRTLVVEEIENGLFPSQAARVLGLLREEVGRGDLRLVATTHSPALLDALQPRDHAGVLVATRGDGATILSRLTDLPQYVDLVGGGQMGRAVTAGVLRDQRESRTLAELFAS